MKKEFKRVFKVYLYGYLNEFNSYNTLRKSESPGISYKEFKIGEVLKYLGVRHNNLLVSAFRLIAHLECYIGFSVVLFRFIGTLLMYMFTSGKELEKKNVILGLNTPKGNFMKMLTSIDMKPDAITVIRLPFLRADYKEFPTISVLSGVKLSDILFSFKYSVRMIFFVKKKYGYRDLLFRSYSSFEYFLSYFFINRSRLTNKYYFVNTYDRWAYIFGDIKHETYFIQHGILSGDVLIKKIGRVDYAYYIDKEQKDICEKILFDNVPVARYRNRMNFSGNGKLLNNNLKNVLLVCNKIFFKKEEEIICKLKNKDVNLYIKPHPAEKDIGSYENLLFQTNFVILDKGDYPEVDFVISYESTLAQEYESKGVRVLKYGCDSFDGELEKLCQS